MTDDTALHTEIASLLVHNLNVDVASVEDDLIDSGLLDSLKIVELLMELESRFMVKIPFEDLELESFRCVASIASLIANLRASIEMMNTPVVATSSRAMPVRVAS